MMHVKINCLLSFKRFKFHITVTKEINYLFFATVN
jgi:hypothetical protein